jgi:hypothetical protein
MERPGLPTNRPANPRPSLGRVADFVRPPVFRTVVKLGCRSPSVKNHPDGDDVQEMQAEVKRVHITLEK